MEEMAAGKRRREGRMQAGLTDGGREEGKAVREGETPPISPPSSISRVRASKAEKTN